MKKIITSILVITTLTITSYADYTDGFERQFNFNSCVEKHIDFEYNRCIHLIDGSYLLSFEDDKHKYLHIDINGNSKEIKTEYQISGQSLSGYFTIFDEVLVDTSEYDAMGGNPISEPKYGVMDENFNVVFEPILDCSGVIWMPYVFDFEDNGFIERQYDAEYYYYSGQNEQWEPSGSKKILINKNFEIWKDYETFYTNFVTENRFIVKANGKSVLIDGDMNIITDKYTHVIELDDGKWYASIDTNQIKPIYSIVFR